MKENHTTRGMTKRFRRQFSQTPRPNCWQETESEPSFGYIFVLLCIAEKKIIQMNSTGRIHSFHCELKTKGSAFSSSQCQNQRWREEKKTQMTKTRWPKPEHKLGFSTQIPNWWGARAASHIFTNILLLSYCWTNCRYVVSVCWRYGSVIFSIVRVLVVDVPGII